VGRKVAALKTDALEALPERCRSCLFWELGYPRPDPRGGNGAPADELAGNRVVQKQAWATAAGLEWAPPGRVVRVDDRTVGYVVFAPAERVAPRSAPVPPTSHDALHLTTLWVEPGFREGGFAKLLVHEAIREAQRHDLAAVEAYGDRRYHEAECVLPAQFLLKVGFEVHREHPRYPLLRLDAKRTLRWAESLEQALDEFLERLPRKVPVPVPKHSPSPSSHPTTDGSARP